MSNDLREPGRPAVLVVEDQAIIRLDLAAELTRHGFAVIEAGDAETGIRLFRERSDIDAGVIDIALPGAMNGYDLVREIRSIRPACTVVVISGSDFVMPEDFDEHVVVESKPLDIAKIALVLRMRHAGTI
ncbi:MAG: Response regulator receiver protein [Enterovirga sp.]|nr:Response regulator receiver protein [Enterovirga sp.]